MAYVPRPLDTGDLKLPAELEPLVELLAADAHEQWAAQRVADGWTWGPQRDDATRQNPCLVPYDQLPDEEKVHDRRIARGVLQAVLHYGYRIEPPG